MTRPPVVVAPLTRPGRRPSPATQARPARLTQRHYDADPEVKSRAPARGESWIPPLGPKRPGGPFEVPAFDDVLDDDDDGPTGQGGCNIGREPAGGQGDDEAAVGGTDDMTEEPDAEAADTPVLGRRARSLATGAQTRYKAV